jgi:DnaJ-class molecular chaperone
VSVWISQDRRECDWCGGTGIDYRDCEWLCVQCDGTGIIEVDYDDENADEHCEFSV